MRIAGPNTKQTNDSNAGLAAKNFVLIATTFTNAEETKMNKGEMKIEILEDGTIKTSTSDMAGPSHKAADDFLKQMARLTGGTVTEEKIKHQHHHHHGTDHEHGHDHEHSH